MWTGPKSTPNSKDPGREGEKGDRGERNSRKEGGLGRPRAAQAESRPSPARPPGQPPAPARGQRRALLTENRPNQQNIFMRVYLSHTDNVLESETSNAPEADSSAVSFMRLRSRRRCPEAYRTVGESQAGPDCRTVNEVACSLQEGHRFVQRRVKLDAQEQRAGLA